MKYMKFIFCAFLLTTSFSGEYLAIHRNNLVEYLRLSLIDSLTFPDSNSIQRGTVLKSEQFFHKIEEFNTLGLEGVSLDINNFGVFEGTTSAFAATPLNFADIVSDEAVLTSTPLTELYDSTGSSLGILIGDTLSVTATIFDGLSDETITAKFIVVNDPYSAGADGTCPVLYRAFSIQQFLLGIENFISGCSWRGGAGSNARIHTAIMPTGRLCIQSVLHSSGQARNLFISSSNIASKAKVSMVFKFPSLIAVGSTVIGEMLLRPAKKNDYFFNPLLYDATGHALSESVPQIFSSNGTLLDLRVGDSIAVSGMVGSTSYGPSELVLSENNGNINTSTTLQNLIDHIRSVLNLPVYDNVIANNPSVSIIPTGSSPVNRSGSLVVRGQPATDMILKDVMIKSRPRNMESRGNVFDASFMLTEQ